MSARQQASWKDDKLYFGTKQSGYRIVPDERYPVMWRVRRPDGTLTDMVNRSRAKDAALDMLNRDMNAPKPS